MPNDENLEIVEQIAENLKDKSDDEIFFEIIRINKEMESELSAEKYNEILEKLDSIRPMLSKAQNFKLDLVLKALKKGQKTKTGVVTPVLVFWVTTTMIPNQGNRLAILEVLYLVSKYICKLKEEELISKRISL